MPRKRFNYEILQVWTWIDWSQSAAEENNYEILQVWTRNATNKSFAHFNNKTQGCRPIIGWTGVLYWTFILKYLCGVGTLAWHIFWWYSLVEDLEKNKVWKRRESTEKKRAEEEDFRRDECLRRGRESSIRSRIISNYIRWGSNIKNRRCIICKYTKNLYHLDILVVASDLVVVNKNRHKPKQRLIII